MQKVTATDEWCAEAYMETDYTKIGSKDFEWSIRNYAMFKLLTSKVDSVVYDIQSATWKDFNLADLFDLKKGRRLTKAHMVAGDVPFIGAIDKNNGVSNYISQAAMHPANTITVNYNGSVAEAFYQPIPYRCSDDVNVLCPKFSLTPAIAMFIVTVIQKEKYRFNYGRKWHLERMAQAKIYLPVAKDGDPDWELIERYIKAFPFGAQLE
jgi:type I restriction enzyme M protein